MENLRSRTITKYRPLLPRRFRTLLFYFFEFVMGNFLSGCGLIPGLKELEPPTNPSIASKEARGGQASAKGEGQPGATGTPLPSPQSSPAPTGNPLPPVINAPTPAPARPAVQCTFRFECVANGASGLKISGTCLNQQVPISISSVSENGSPVFPSCIQVRPIFIDALPTGTYVATLEGGPTLKARCEGASFSLNNGGMAIQMNLPQAVCLELRDRVNALKL